MTTNLAGKVAKAGDTMSGDQIWAETISLTQEHLQDKPLSALYADLAEMYTADAEYEAGTVMMFGGDAEVTAPEGYGAPKMEGVVSTNPAYLMNKDGGNCAVALQGRVP